MSCPRLCKDQSACAQTSTVAPRSGGQLAHAGEPRAVPSEKINLNQRHEVQLRSRTGHTACQRPPRRAARSSCVHQGGQCPRADPRGSPLGHLSCLALGCPCKRTPFCRTVLNPSEVGTPQKLTADAAHRSRPCPAGRTLPSRCTLASRPRRPPVGLSRLRRLASRKKHGWALCPQHLPAVVTSFLRSEIRHQTQARDRWGDPARI